MSGIMIENQHGEVTVERISADIILATLVGSFNEIGAKAYVTAIRKEVNKQNKPFAILVNNLKMEGGTPEAYQILQQHNNWLATTAIKAKAIVTKEMASIELIKSLSPAIKQLNMASFQEVDTALEWLEAQL